ncbi:DNA-deoxyinosine glycosylase [Empedobacter tilapiae]|uniref:DNA-deoxyinosine glycosylase n=1 Tax=Empedobacter tilapiae TaxID=2491114 RepID=A0A4Z1BJR8_9FLAO|nr:DNA-deoxyinosine glycosylase [Empedobacter tilapiae]TGN30171.1 DNA-deoxyinosine glycosylase [Empedobacter tilapiae]
MYKKSFESIISLEPRILILGSLPGDLSLEINQYYGHPRNRFWKMMFEIFETEFSEDYGMRKQLILQNKFALWDVAHSADRKGSMDAEMKNVLPNQIDELLNEHPTIKKIIFNGKKAEQLFWKYFDKKLSIEYISLPSTSPANAQFSYERLMEIWKKAII